MYMYVCMPAPSLCGGPGRVRTNVSLARRCRRRHLWTAVIEKTKLSRERLIEYMPPRMLHDRCEVLELSVLIPAELPVSCDLLCDVTLIESMPGLPICPWTPASTIRKVLREPQTCSDALPAVCAPSIGLIAEGRASRQADLQRLAAMVHKSTLAAMPYEIVEPPPGTEAYCRHRIDMEAEIRRALIALPPEISIPFLEMVGKVVGDVMDAAHREKLEIGSGLQRKWQTMSSEERSPWKEQHRLQMEEYQKALRRHREGCAPEPKRPPGMFFMWIHEAMQSEWARRRDSKR